MSDNPEEAKPAETSTEDLRRAVLYLADAMLAIAEALERFVRDVPPGTHGPFSGLDAAVLRMALGDAERRLVAVVDLLTKKNGAAGTD